MKRKRRDLTAVFNPKTEIEPRIRLRQGFLLRQGFGGQDDGQVARMGTDVERVMETIFKPVRCILKSVKIRAI
jgi:hypothetical protein